MVVAAIGLTESLRRDSAEARNGFTDEAARREDMLIVAVKFL